MRSTLSSAFEFWPDALGGWPKRRAGEIVGAACLACVGGASLALMSWSVTDPSFNNATAGAVHNWLGRGGAVFADLAMQGLGVASFGLVVVPAFWGWRLITKTPLRRPFLRLLASGIGLVALATAIAAAPPPGSWPLLSGLGGVVGDAGLFAPRWLLKNHAALFVLFDVAMAGLAILGLSAAAGYGFGGQDEEFLAKPELAKGAKPIDDEDDENRRDGEPGLALIAIGALLHGLYSARTSLRLRFARKPKAARETQAPWKSKDTAWREPALDAPWPHAPSPDEPATMAPLLKAAAPVAATALTLGPAPAGSRMAVTPALEALKPALRAKAPIKPSLKGGGYQVPALTLLADAKRVAISISNDALEQNARLLEGVLDDFGVKGEIINVRPGPVVTLYELEPAPGVKSSRVIGLADDIARSMSAISARVAVVQGRNAIGIELPNQKRETVFLREMLASQDFVDSKQRLAIALGKTIGGEPVIVDLAKMPHLLVAGTTGSGKSVAINTFICSLLYRLKPEQCRLIMVDPKMLELSVYDGIPHLLTPVVTDPKKAVVALKWAVREMEERYKKMSKLGVRNIDGFNARVVDAAAKNETITRTVQTGFDKETGEATYETEAMELSELPYIVVVVDEMADLMMVAGKDIEGAIQRLAQMARAAGIHLIMATQRPSVDVITGTIKANFPTRISFQVTSKIDSRTILGEQGAEQLLGQGDMLYMAGGGRISRVHGPFVSDVEVEKVVAYLKTQGQPEYLSAITEEDAPEGEDEEDAAPASNGGSGMTMDEEEAGDIYDRAVNIVLRDRRVSTSYIQRRLSVGYNKAASLIERMEKEGVVSPPSHSGKREILVGNGVDRAPFVDADEE